MHGRPRQLSVGLLVTAASAAVVWVVCSRSGSGDYQVHGRPGADNAGPPLMALVHGHLTALPRLQTVMGPVSLLWRAPFVAVATAFGAGPRLGYEVGAIACLLGLVGLVGWIATRAPTARQLAAAGLAGFVMILGPSTAGAVTGGHPEELLTTMLAVAAVLVARSDRPLWAGLLLGLAIASKEWALFATPAVVLAAPGSRGRLIGAAAGVAVLLGAPLPLLDPAALHRADALVGPLSAVSQETVWWVSSPVTAAGHHLPLHLHRPEATAIASAVAALSVAIAGLALRRRAAPAAPARAATAPRIDAMALLTLCLLIRCLADPSDSGYYLVAVTVPLALWEAGVLRRLPVAALLAWAVDALCFTAAYPFAIRPAALHGAAAVLGFLTAAVVLGAYLTLRTFVRPPPRRAPAPATGHARALASAGAVTSAGAAALRGEPDRRRATPAPGAARVKRRRPLPIIPDR